MSRTNLLPVAMLLLLACSTASSETVLMMEEDFEYGLPTPLCKLEGWPTWATVDERHSDGWYSAYCAGSYNAPPGPYDNNMNAWMIFGPFDLSDAYDAWFEFDLWLESERYDDYFKRMVSVDGHQYYGHSESGNTSSDSDSYHWWDWYHDSDGDHGWDSRDMDLTDVPHLGNVCGERAIWIAFVFTSDDSVEYEGAYVDNVRVYKKTTSAVPPTTRSISGRVIGFDGLGVPGVALYAGTHSSGPSDSDGRYTIPDVPQGTYALRGSFVGYDVFAYNFENPVRVSFSDLRDYNFVAVAEVYGEVICLPPAALDWHYREKIPLPSTIDEWQKPRWYLASGESLPPAFHLKSKGRLKARARDVRVPGDYAFRLLCVPTRGGTPVTVLCLLSIGEAWNSH